MQVTKTVAILGLAAAATTAMPVGGAPAIAAGTKDASARGVPAPSREADALGSPAMSACGPVGFAGRSAGTPGGPAALDGFRIGWLPPGLGTSMSDFAYEWDDVSFASRVWESGSDDDGWNVDLHVTVLRGDVLDDPAGMHTFLADYHEKDPRTWAQQMFDHRGRPGFRTESAVFWLAEPGVAVWVRLDPRFGDQALVRTACGVIEDTSDPAGDLLEVPRPGEHQWTGGG